ncbi:olfactory receptor 8D4-like [Rhinatrema bivittatum]|uniref:olfactory receptor 8D4-like n=1 Tax=Rhinatrema bivittatum TaxID=194408 RepID=UPI00112C1FE5|nr:olfactory receptor 8D4-like [Rhinatrema bivittatum]
MEEIEKANQTTVTEFIILGFSDLPEMQLVLFLLFLIIYLMSMVGNLLIISAVCSEPRFHTPMFFFLINLSFLEICYVTVTVPRLLVMLITKIKTICLSACLAQLYLFLSCTCTEFYLLTAMAYDRYVAICNPLRYTIIMNKKVYSFLVAVSWIIGFLDPVAHVIFASKLIFCGSNIINHFFCDITALMKLSCSGAYIIENVNYIVGSLFAFSPFLLTIASYVFIITTILKIQSAEGRGKTFSTCSSHLTVVILFYGTSMGVYMRPSTAFSMNQNKLLTVVYITAIPLLNPFIYGLRNKELKFALWKAIRRLDSYFSQRVRKCRTCFCEKAAQYHRKVRAASTDNVA